MKRQRYITPATEIAPLELQGSLMAVSVYGYNNSQSDDTITNGDGDGNSDGDGTIWFDSKENIFPGDDDFDW